MTLVYTPRMDLICDYLLCEVDKKEMDYWLWHELFGFINNY